MSNHSQLTRTKHLLRRLTRKLPIRTLRPNILPAAFLKSFPVSFRRSQTDCAECSKRPTSSNNRLPIIRIWDQPQTRQAIRVGFYELGEIIRHVLPRKLEVFGIVGTGDPASTGQIMAIQGMLYPWHKGNIRLEPDFEEKYIEGELHLKGRIRLGTLGICGLRILLNKNVRRLIRILRKKEEA